MNLHFVGYERAADGEMTRRDVEAVHRHFQTALKEYLVFSSDRRTAPSVDDSTSCLNSMKIKRIKSECFCDANRNETQRSIECSGHVIVSAVLSGLRMPRMVDKMFTSIKLSNTYIVVSLWQPVLHRYEICGFQ